MDKLELLKKCAFFSDIDDVSLAGLHKIVSEKKYSKGQMIFSEGEDPTALHILGTGSVDLVKLSPEGKEKLIRTVKPGEVFAEAAVFSGETYPATAMARSESRLFTIERSKFISFVRSNPAVAIKMLGTMSRLLRHMNDLLSDLTLGSVSSRLAKFLVRTSEEEKNISFKLPVRKNDLAFILGTVSETLSRNIKKFKELGLIEVRGNLIRIRDLKKLKELT